MMKKSLLEREIKTTHLYSAWTIKSTIRCLLASSYYVTATHLSEASKEWNHSNPSLTLFLYQWEHEKQQEEKIPCLKQNKHAAVPSDVYQQKQYQFRADEPTWRNKAFLAFGYMS